MVLLSHQRLQVWDCLLTQAIKSSTAGANERSGICLKQQPKPTVYTYARQYAQKVLLILIMCIVAVLDTLQLALCKQVHIAININANIGDTVLHAVLIRAGAEMLPRDDLDTI